MFFVAVLVVIGIGVGVLALSGTRLQPAATLQTPASILALAKLGTEGTFSAVYQLSGGPSNTKNEITTVTVAQRSPAGTSPSFSRGLGEWSYRLATADGTDVEWVVHGSSLEDCMRLAPVGVIGMHRPRKLRGGLWRQRLHNRHHPVPPGDGVQLDQLRGPRHASAPPPGGPHGTVKLWPTDLCHGQQRTGHLVSDPRRAPRQFHRRRLRRLPLGQISTHQRASDRPGERLRPLGDPEGAVHTADAVEGGQLSAHLGHVVERQLSHGEWNHSYLR